MQRRFCLLSTLIVAGALGLGGCPSPTDPMVVLTEEQKAAVKFVAEQLRAANAVFATLHPLSDPQMNLNTIGQIGVFGTCPRTSFVSNADSVVASIKFDPACAANITANKTVGGELSIRITRATRAAAIEFKNLVVAGKAITGRIDATIQARTGGITATGTCLITTADVGTVSGTFTMQIDNTGKLTFTTAALTTVSGSTSQLVALTDVLYNPVTTASFLPTAGTAGFNVGNDALLMTFATQTPTNGTVQVKVGTGTAGNYQIPDLVP